jgi:hypothetical protein
VKVNLYVGLTLPREDGTCSARCETPSEPQKVSISLNWV